MRIKPTYLGIFILVVFMGTVYAFRAAGVWSVSGKVDNQGQSIQPLREDTSSIKGWMTLEQITSVYGVKLEEIVTRFNLPADTSLSTAVKDLESDTFSVEGLREWLESRQAAPEGQAEPTEQAALTEQAEQAAAPTNQAEAPEERAPQNQAQGQANTEEHDPAERTVTGQTTFHDLLDWGLTAEAIGQVIGASMPEPATLVKDFVTQGGGSFGPLKNALQDAVDQIR